MKQDLEHLKLLSVFHYVWGGITALISCIPLIHVAFGVLLLFLSRCPAQGQTAPPPAIVGWMFILIGGGIIMVGWAVATAIVMAGYFLDKRRHWVYCLIVAAVCCTMMPVGTVLGVFTIIVLMRPSVKELFTPPKAA